MRGWLISILVIVVTVLLLMPLFIPGRCEVPGSKALEILPRDVVDGDTFKKNGRYYRLVGIDAPELKSRVKPKGEFAEEAKIEFERLVGISKECVLEVGRDKYGRNLVYVFSNGGEFLLEASLTELGLVRPLFFWDTFKEKYASMIVRAYRKAWRNHAGIFSKWSSAPVVRMGDDWEKMIGKIVWLEDEVVEVIERNDSFVLVGKYSRFVLRKVGMKLCFGSLNPKRLRGKRLKVYGELWKWCENERCFPEILVRADFEMRVVEE